MIDLDALRLLRPLWLIALPVVGVAWWWVRRRDAQALLAQGFFAPHLAEALTIDRRARSVVRPIDLTCVTALLLIIAASGPSWNKDQSPWFSETAPLVVAIEVSDSMRANDWAPSRLERARFKVLDLVRERTGSRTALIAYAGSAHIVVPPSKDVSVIETFLGSLDPGIMPAPGSDMGGVVPLARQLLGDEVGVGTLLFVGDGMTSDDVAALQSAAGERDMPWVAMLLIGSEEGGVALMPDGSAVREAGGRRLDTGVDVAGIQRLAAGAGVQTVAATRDGGDVARLLRLITSNLSQADDPDARWRDRAWLFLWPCALLSLVWFRRGWTMQW